MDPVEVFEKILTETDIKHRLSFPTEHLDALPFEGESRKVDFQVSPCGNEETSWTFRCIKRDEDYTKPTIQKGWAQFVREKELQIGDLLKFYTDKAENSHPPRYWITVERRVTLLFGVPLSPNPDGKYWYRIV